MSLPWATAADLIRIQEKDAYYQQELFQQLKNTSLLLLGQTRVRFLKKELKLLSDLISYLPLLLHGQTLGEQYVFCQTNQSSKRQFLFVVFHVLIPYALPKLFQQFNKYSEFKKSVEFLKSLNSAWFYLYPHFYFLSHRFLNMRFKRLSNLRPNEPSTHYHALGILLVLQALIRLGFKKTSLKKSHETDHLISDSNKQCMLCLSERKCSTSTPCGHVFCYYCIADWVRTKPECPLCRHSVQMNEFICLR